jgi:hypothetical protein
MPTKAKKLPSGNWRVRVQIESTDGKQHYKSFTAPSRKEVEFLASQFALTQQQDLQPQAMTIGKAVDSYIDARSPCFLQPLFAYISKHASVT